MTALLEFQLLRPATASEAVRLHALHPGSRYLAGGTDLLPNLRRGLVMTGVVIDLGGISGLAEIIQEGDFLCLGSGLSLATLAAHQTVREGLPALAQAAASVAGPTHRVAATLGGNLCLETRCRFFNQSETWRQANDFCLKLGSDTCRVATRSSRCYAAFSGDLAPALMVLGAEAQLLGPSGSRCVPFTEFYRDDGKAWLALAPDELLVAVRIPLHRNWQSGYEKVRVRASLDFPLAGVAVALRRKGEALAGLRIALTGVASRPEYLSGLDDLAGKPLDEAAWAVLMHQLKAGTQVMGTTLVEVSYRRAMIPALAKRLVTRLWTAGEVEVGKRVRGFPETM